MKILMLTPYLPYPLVSGGQIRTYNLLKQLHKHHEITLFAYIRNDSERQHIKELEKYCYKIKVFKRGDVWTLKNILLSQFSYNPLLVTMYRSRELERAIALELATDSYNLIHAETFYMMPNIPKTSKPIILVIQTIEHLGYMDFTRQLRNPLAKPFFYWDVHKIKYWEERFWKSATRLITMSEEDRRYISRLIPAVGPVDVVANGVDIEFFKKAKKKTDPKAVTVLFVGTFKWLPNVEAVTYLVEKVWNLIKAKVPNARLMIVGNSPTDRIKAYADADSTINVLGFVEDIRDAYNQADMLLAPVWSGKGTRYKILEAMATNTPVVATPIAVEGLGVKDQVHALIGKDPESLAAQVVKLSLDKKLSQKLASNGQALVKEQYDWNTIAKKLDGIYSSVGK